MAEPFATLADLRARWPGLPVDDEAEADMKLAIASRQIRARPWFVDARIAAGTLDPETVKDVVCAMVKRAMDVDADLENVANINAQAGPFGQTISFKNTDGAIYIGKSDVRLLAPPRSGRAFSTMPG